MSVSIASSYWGVTLAKKLVCANIYYTDITLIAKLSQTKVMGIKEKVLN